jgi:peptide/nickel transport system substrate-binding protein
MGDLARRFGALAVAVAVTSAGCSKTESGTAPPSAVKPGIVRIVGFGSNDSLVPELSASASAIDVAQFWGAWLFLVNEKGDLEPDLATEIPTYDNGGVSRDGKTITYHLRRGVTWHDGAPFDARDVIFTWHAVMNPRNNVLTREGYDDIATITAPDPYTVRVTLHHAYAPAVATFFGPSLQPMCILPAHILKDLPDINHAAYDNKPIGTGPFVVDTYEPGTKIVLKSNPRYWRGPPHLREVDFLVVPDPNTQEVMVRTGEADLYYDPPGSQVAELRAIPDVHVGAETFNEYWYLTFNESNPPLNDVRVRRAIASGIDRNGVVRSIMHGNATLAQTDQPPFSWAIDPSVREPKFDPAAANRLLDDAGWRMGPDGVRQMHGKRLSLVFVTSTGWEDARRFGVLFERWMAQIGVAVTIKLYPTSILEASQGAGGILNNGKFDLALDGWIAGVDPDDSTLWTCDQAPPAGWNHSHSCDPRIDAQERIALTHYDRATRRAAYWRIQRLLADDLPVVFLYYAQRNDAVRNGFIGYRPAPAVTEFWNTWEWQMQ